MSLGGSNTDNVYIDSSVPPEFTNAMTIFFLLLFVFAVLSCFCVGFNNNALTDTKVERTIKADLEYNSQTEYEVKVIQRLNILESGAFYGKFKVKVNGELRFYECESGYFSPIICAPYVVTD